MSTKTNFKRIALVAVTSLGFGLISSVPASQAVVQKPTVTVTNGTAASGSNYDSSSEYATVSVVATVGNAATDSVVVFLTHNSLPASATFDTGILRFTDTSSSYTIPTVVDTKAAVTAAAADTKIVQSVPASAASVPVFDTITTAPLSGSIITSDGFRMLAATVGNGTNTSTFSSGVVYAGFRVELDSNVARTIGTYTYNLNVRYNSASGVVTDVYPVSIVVSRATADSLTASASYSNAVLFNNTPSDAQAWSASFSSSQADSVVSIPSYASQADSASIVVRLRNASGNAKTGMESITATTTVGTLCGPTSAGIGRTTCGQNITLPYIGDSLTIGISGNGTAGTASIVVKSTSVTFAAKSVTFYATAVATITGTKLLNTLATGTNTGVILATAKDSAGFQNNSGTAVYAYSSDTTIVSTYGSACGYNSTYGGQLCTLTGVTAGTVTITLRNASTVALSTVTGASTFTVTVSTNALNSIKLRTDKASYAPGEKGYLLVDALDSAGKAVAANTFANLFAAGGITTDAQLGSSSDTLTAVSITTASSSTGYLSVEPVKIYTFYAPQKGGKFTFTATGGASLPAAAQVAVTASAEVSDNASAALAAVTALASQVSAFITKINAQITTLTDLVMKIQKKVKA